MADVTANLYSDLQREIDNLKARLAQLRKPMAIDSKKERALELHEQMLAPDFWADQSRASKLQKEKTGLEKDIKRFADSLSGLDDASELLEMVSEDFESLTQIKKDVQKIEDIVHALEMERLLGEASDPNNAILSINVGQGGVEAQDFVEMLLRMYRHYAEKKGFSFEITDIAPGEEAGLKSVTVLIGGEYAYGYLKSEVGVHRLVRISPFDSNARRHTSFASVWVIPEVDDSIEIDIKTEDLRIDTFRAGGAGGQHVNKTESAVRITHLPTNTVAACQAERSQAKNKVTAMKLLRSKLYDLEMKKRLADRDKAEATKMEASFGSQIRNYVLAPYRLIKDLRTNFEVGNVDAVLDGDLQPFIDAYLLHLQEEKHKD